MVGGRTILWAVALVLACGSPVHADKLVVFHNGRTLRVENVRDEGQWLFLTLGKKSEMGVLTRLIASVDDIEGEAPAQLPNVQSAAGGGTTANRGGTVGNRMAGGQRSAAGRQPPMVQGGAAAAGQQVEADRARGDALSRAAARATRGSKLGLIPGSTPPAGEGETPESTDLSTAGTSAGWRSLLDDSRGGRSGRQRDDEPRQDDEDPQR